MTRQEKQASHWSLDKKVPITLIIAILGQSAALGWFAASITERVNALEQRSIAIVPQSERLARVEVQIETVKEGVGEIKRLIQQQQRR
jgi:hypothetical protein